MATVIPAVCLDGKSSFADIPSSALPQFFSPKQAREKIPIQRLFLARYHDSFYCTSQLSSGATNYFHVPSILTYLRTEFHHDLCSDIIVRAYSKRAQEYYVNHRLCDLGNGIMIYFSAIQYRPNVDNPNQYAPDYSDDYFLTCTKIKLCYYPQRDTLANEISRKIRGMNVLQPTRAILKLIMQHLGHAYRLTCIRIKPPVMLDLALQYGPGFVKVHDRIVKALNTKAGKGLVLLHGKPGTGKTYYIRHLISVIQGKSLIYVPPNLVKDITKPSFLTFLLKQRNSVLIIEDADHMLRDRSDSSTPSSQAAANLLNLSDGLLGDAMSIQMVITFNCDLTRIDQALVRPGRLIASHNFDQLDTLSAKLLSSKLGFATDHIDKPMTLAEIYNSSEPE